MTVDATALAALVTGFAFFADVFFFARDARAVFAAFTRLVPAVFFARFAPLFFLLLAIDPPASAIARDSARRSRAHPIVAGAAWPPALTSDDENAVAAIPSDECRLAG